MRAVLDRLISWFGLLLALLLLIAGALLTWGNVYIGDMVQSQLSEQRITMPDDAAIKGDEALSTEDKDAMKAFAGQKLESGDQARAYAEHYIKPHMNHSAAGKTYSEVSGEFMGKCVATDKPAADCDQLAQSRQTLFMGDTLRGLLLYGFAFATIGKLMGYAAIAAFLGALLMLVLGLLGFRHAKQASTA